MKLRYHGIVMAWSPFQRGLIDTISNKTARTWKSKTDNIDKFQLYYDFGCQLKNNSGQVTWLYEKQVTEKKEPQEFQTFQEFLDKSQYSINGILRYEKIFGPGQCIVVRS